VQFPITFGLHRSRFLDAALMVIVVLAGVAILGFRSSVAIRVGLLLALLVLAIQTWRALTPTIRSIRLERSGEIYIARVGESEFVQAVPKPGATIHPWLTVIRLSAADGQSATLIATVNRKNSQNMKRLRMFMRWQASFRGPNDDA
jgi:toxin CptA